MVADNKKIGGGGFHHLALRVRDIEKSIKFYTEVLGFRQEASFPHPWDEDVKKIVLLDTGDGNYLEIFSNGPENNNSEGIYFHVAFRTDNVDAVIDNVKKAGIEVTVEPKDVHLANKIPIEIRVAFIKGPDGESIEFYQDY